MTSLPVMAEQPKRPQLAVADAIRLLQTFRGTELTQTIYQIEVTLRGVSVDGYLAVLATSGAKEEVLGAAGLIKQLAGQINVVIHTLGILVPPSYPSIRRNHRVRFTG